MHFIKNIVISFAIAIYFVIVSHSNGVSIYKSHIYIPTSFIYYCESAARAESGDSQPEYTSEKPKSLLIKVDIQPGFLIPFIQFPRISEFVVVKSTSPYRLSPQIVYVRYLPRDPPTA
jgi:hypothetical protein